MSRVDQGRHPEQRLHEEPGGLADPGDCRLHVSGRLQTRHNDYQGGRCGVTRLCHGM